MIARLLPVSLLILLAIHPAGAQQPDVATRPNIIIFLADDMGMGDTSAYQDWSGNADAEQLHTPSLEKLANMGVRFTDAHSPSSRCSPTRYAMLTGRYCWRTRLKQWVLFGVQCPPLIARERQTLPEFLKTHGYRTGMVGKWHLGITYHMADGSLAKGWDDADLKQPLADGPLDHGFDYFHGFSQSHPTSGPDGAEKNAPDQAIGPGWLHGRAVVGATGNGKQLDGSYKLDEIGPVLDQHAFAFLRAANADGVPFFLYFASPANHSPYTPCKRIGPERVAGASRYVDQQPTGKARLDFVYQNDVHIGRLLDYLEQTNDPRRAGHKLIENTLFVFSSDNGAEKNNKRFTGPLRSNKGSVYAGGHRVPFIASWPLGRIGDADAQSDGKSSARLLSLTDLYATIAEVIGQPLAEGQSFEIASDSVSQLAALRGEKCEPRIPVFPNDHKQASQQAGDERAWVAVRSNAAPLPGQWKLFLDHRFACQQELQPQELYNLANDPMEQRNLLKQENLKSVVEFLLQAARNGMGDAGHTRP